MTEFPSEAHRQSLLGKVERGGLAALDSEEKLRFHAYRYAWRRVRLGDFAQKYGGDPNGEHFDGVLVGQAYLFYGGKPPRPKRPDPTPAEIAHVEECCRQIRANLEDIGALNRAAFGSGVTGAPDHLEILKAGLGLGAIEQRGTSDDIAA
jgi:hypothetical protein